MRQVDSTTLSGVEHVHVMADVTGLSGALSGHESRISALEQGGTGGTSDYSKLTNKPSINSVTLSGNKTLADLGIAAASHTHDYAPASHYHVIQEVQNLQDALNDKANTSHEHAEYAAANHGHTIYALKEENGIVNTDLWYGTGSGNTMVGTYQLSGNYCTLTVLAKPKAEWQDCSWSLPVAWTHSNSGIVVAASDGTKVRVRLNQITQNENETFSVLTMNCADGGNFSSDKEVSFTMIYKYK